MDPLEKNIELELEQELGKLKKAVRLIEQAQESATMATKTLEEYKKINEPLDETFSSLESRLSKVEKKVWNVEPEIINDHQLKIDSHGKQIFELRKVMLPKVEEIDNLKKQITTMQDQLQQLRITVYDLTMSNKKLYESKDTVIGELKSNVNHIGLMLDENNAKITKLSSTSAATIFSIIATMISFIAVSIAIGLF